MFLPPIPWNIYIKQGTTSSYGAAACIIDNPIDVTSYKKLAFVLESLEYDSGQGKINLYLGLHTQSQGSLSGFKAKYSRNVVNVVTSTLSCEIDISNLTGEHYIQLGIYGSGTVKDLEYNISNIYFVK